MRDDEHDSGIGDLFDRFAVAFGARTWSEQPDGVRSTIKAVAAQLVGEPLGQAPDALGKVYTVQELAARFQVSEDLIRDELNAGRLVGAKLGGCSGKKRAGVWRVRATDAEQWFVHHVGSGRRKNGLPHGRRAAIVAFPTDGRGGRTDETKRAHEIPPRAEG
jgi:hypothetical protein